MTKKWATYQFVIYFARKVQIEKDTNKREKTKAKGIEMCLKILFMNDLG